MTQVPLHIPMLDLRPEIEELWDDLVAAFERVMKSGRFILGPEVEAFEHEVAEYLGVGQAIGVNSGTDALVISLRAAGIGPGDEVITTPFTFFATPESIANVGATPVFVDIDPRTFNIDPLLIEPAITGRTRAILPVHLYGQACQMGPIMDIALEHGLKVIEDCAQAMGGAYKGRKVGTFGDAAALSFFPSKNLGGFGDGGMIVTSDAEVAELARMLRAHGAKRKYDHEMLGYNSRLDELQAALLRIRLPHLDRLNEGRRAAAAAYGEELAGNEFVTVPLEDPDAYHVFHQYTVRVPQGRRDSVRAALGASGIDTMIYYPIPGDATVALQAPAVLPVAGVAAGEVLSLPMSAELGPAVARRLAASLG